MSLPSDMTLVRTLHERREGWAAMALCVYERSDGSRIYGVEKDGELQMTGTKAEAKAFYGNWRKTW